MSRRRIAQIHRELARQAEEAGKINTNESFFADLACDYSQPRCTLWHHRENWERFGEHTMGPGTPNPFYCQVVRCPFAEPVGDFITMGMGTAGKQAGPKPCSTCELPIPVKSATHSSRIRPGIPVEVGHLFR